MPFRKGQPPPPGAGRKPGVPNKATADVKAALLEAFRRKGDVDFLLRLDDVTFAGLLRKLIPNEVAATIDHRVAIRLVDLSDKRSDDGVA